MEPIAASADLVAYCGLYCGACGRYRKGRCEGCRENARAGWCKVRSCCIENGWASCADCETYTDLHQCGKFHNVFSRIIGFVLNSDRHKCIDRIREIGPAAYAEEMAAKGVMKLPRR